MGYAFRWKGIVQSLGNSKEPEDVYKRQYGDSFVRTEDAIEQIGNNVSLEFSDMDFGTDASDSIVICGRTPLQHNTIQLRFSNGETQVPVSYTHLKAHQITAKEIETYLQELL